MAKEPLHKKMYKDSPEMKRDNDSGKMEVKKKPAGKETKAEEVSERTSDGTSGIPVHEEHAKERLEMRHRHIKEHMDLHTKHAHEHVHHEGEKEHLHEKHEREHADMHERHHKEMKKMHERHESEHGTESEGSGGGEKKIEKVEKSKE